MARSIQPASTPAARAYRAAGARRAFTMIEILVVTVILSIVAAIVAPEFGTRDDLQCSSAARQVIADLLYAQNRAIATGQWHYVVFDTGSQSYSVYAGTASGPQTLLTIPATGMPYTMSFSAVTGCNVGQSVGSGNVTLSSANFSASPTLSFDELGVPYSFSSSTNTALSSAGTVSLACGGSAMTVSVQPNTGDVTSP